MLRFAAQACCSHIDRAAVYRSAVQAVVNGTKTLVNATSSATSTLRRNVENLLVGHSLETSFLVSQLWRLRCSAQLFAD